MDIITKEVGYIDIEMSKKLEKNMCFIDIETTGLNRDNDIIYLIGILYYDMDMSSWKIKQYFAEDLKDEVRVLQNAIEYISSFSSLVSYNGDSFDIPFIKHRLKLLNISWDLPRDRSLDIYAILRKNRMYLNMNNLKLKTVENYLGIFREDIYTGKDCISFYRDYILNGNKTLKEKILKHNFDDLYYLLPVLNILDKLEGKKTFYINHNDVNYPFLIEEIELINDFLIIKARTNQTIFHNSYHYSNRYKIIINNENKIEVSLEVSRGLIAPTEEALYIQNSKFGIKGFIGEKYNYNIGEDITIITIGKKYMIGNIKNILAILIENIL